MAETADDFIWSSPKRLQDKYLALLETGTLSDAQVRCGERTWKIHKSIVCHQSEWFRKALTGPFKETETGIIDITNFEEYEIDCLLQFIYTGAIDVSKILAAHGDCVIASMFVWRVGDFFLLEDLCKLSFDFFKSKLCKTSWTLASKSILQDAEQLVRNHIKVVSKLYEPGTGDQWIAFRPTTLSLLVSSIHIFVKSREFVNLLHELPEFSSDWAVAITNSIGSINPPPSPYSSNQCKNCRKVGKTHFNHTKWFQKREIELLCEQCFPPL